MQNQADGSLLARVCPTCEPEGSERYHDLVDAVAEYERNADSDCWHCAGYGLLVGEPDAWEIGACRIVEVADGG